VTFEETPAVHEFETDDDESVEDRPRISIGEEIALSDEEDDGDSVDTETELATKAETSETVALNL
jgi:hypothetical protein